MKLTHLLLAALVALPLGLAGCDASGPDDAAALAVTPPGTLSNTSAPDALASATKSAGPISGPTTLSVGGLGEYEMEGATTLHIKELDGSAEEEYGGTRPSEGAPIRYIGVRALAVGDIQIEGYHPQFGWSYLTVTIGPGSSCNGVAGSVVGPATLGLNQTATYTASCAQNIRAGATSQGSVQILSETQGTNAQGLPMVTSVIKGTGVGTVRLRSKLTTSNGIVSGPLRVITVEAPTPPLCDQTITTVDGITGPNAVPLNGLATYMSNGAENMGSKNAGGILTKLFGEIDNGAYVADYRADQVGPAQVTADLPNGTRRTRTVQICSAP